MSAISLLWTPFESGLLNTEGSARSICNMVDSWQKDGTLDAPSFDAELSYFRMKVLDRYGALLEG
ncbi:MULTISPECIES: hypothetical protein [unclassified Mesorhizobium]|uniref:hypothetical protein n=1 Tax=unclassified Mesorhizobium TaxID=325217 RepID=UPI000F764281|nr:MULTISPECIES: hypothetical protein [unclassified Mesorhizobium]AZO18080.1 hypothetical protein EJ069_27420 [Mesorhizobium sp. M2A.F.Ca.ET.043.05.1.1]RVB72050.1 hypothetical protein EN885_30520 [Mesorhizobium sp. M6A.T.Cr.TU.014.01.1.1]RWP97809.1 MAG: hypothetical protein EOR90_27565 [Mesorhizobium sp.]RWP98719.1 MAG: hypothetical protein EOR91_27685 [Mesorhizobium sp.]